MTTDYDESEAFTDAYHDCLKSCFAVLAQGLAEQLPTSGAPGPEARFRNCCENCRKAKAIADAG